MITRQYYCEDLVRRPDRLIRVLIHVRAKEPYLIHTLPRWLEQTYAHLQLVILDSSNQYAPVAEICQRHQKSLVSCSFDSIPEQTTECVYVNYDAVKDDSVRHIISSTLPDDMVCILPLDHSIPVAYFCEQAILSLDVDVIDDWGSCFVGTIGTFRNKTSRLRKRKTLSIANLEVVNEYDKKCTVFLPCMNREDNLKSTLPMWINQKYNNKQIVVIDYSSQGPLEELTRQIADEHKMSFDVYENGGTTDAAIILVKVPGMQHFNISHAYNYAIKRIPTDIVCTVCGDSCPRDYYLDVVASMVDDNTLIQCWWGLHTITYKNWQRLNGHQEFVVGWGAEDDDFRYRAQLLGLNVLKITDNLVFHIPQKQIEKGKHRKITDTTISADINSMRFHHYIAGYGAVANYGKEIGCEEPIQFSDQIETNNRISICEYETLETPLDPAVVEKVNENLFYVLIRPDNREWAHYNQWQQFGKIKRHEVRQMITDDEAEVNLAVNRFIKGK